MLTVGLVLIQAGASRDEVTLIKALLTARDILLEEFQNLSKAIDQSFDFTDFMSRIDDTKYIGVLMPSKMDNVKGEVSRQGKPQNGLEVHALFQTVYFFFSFCFLTN